MKDKLKLVLYAWILAFPFGYLFDILKKIAYPDNITIPIRIVSFLTGICLYLISLEIVKIVYDKRSKDS